MSNNKKKTDVKLVNTETDFVKCVLKLENIFKSFLNGKIIANNNINISFLENEIHALVAENGSGKTTLMNIVFGLYKQDKGNIYFDNKKVDMYQSGAAKKYKIGMVHQHFHLVDNFSVLENIILGQEKIEKSVKTKEKIKALKKEFNLVRSELKNIKISDAKNIKLNFKNELNLNNKLLEIKNELKELKNKKAKISNEKEKKLNNIKKKINLKKSELTKIEEKLNSTKNYYKKLRSKDQKDFLKGLFKEKELSEQILINDSKLIGIFGNLKKKSSIERLNRIQEKYNINLNPNAKVSTLSVGQRQMVEILKVLWEDKKIIVFDEPTATLSVIEIDYLLNTIKALKREGKTIIFISHKLKEVKEISDRISILRKGELIGTYKNDNKLQPADIGEKMVGKEINFKYPSRNITGKEILQVKNLSYRTHSGFRSLDNISFSVKEGEIFGLAGIEGNGQEEVIKILTNLRKPYKGMIEYDGELLTNEKGYHLKSVARRELMSHIPIDRLKHGVVPFKSLEFNARISDYDTSFFGFKRSKLKEKISEFTQSIINGMNVEGAFNNMVEIRNLSGGNQQKFVVGREIFRDHKILIAGHPTRGLDISAIDHIYKRMIENSKNKITILYSLEISELVSVCDRIAIMYKGKIVDIINPKNTKMETISKMMIGETQ